MVAELRGAHISAIAACGVKHPKEIHGSTWRKARPFPDCLAPLTQGMGWRCRYCGYDSEHKAAGLPPFHANSGQEFRYIPYGVCCICAYPDRPTAELCPACRTRTPQGSKAKEGSNDPGVQETRSNESEVPKIQIYVVDASDVDLSVLPCPKSPGTLVARVKAWMSSRSRELVGTGNRCTRFLPTVPSPWDGFFGLEYPACNPHFRSLLSRNA